jgi:lipopolysaccharide/colanic/teichoic acid biosynthesis glycosyltransferase
MIRQIKRNYLLLKPFLWKFTITVTLKTKRFLDFIISLFLIIFLLPFFVLVSLIIYVDNPGPIIFTQKRVGKFGRVFDFYKFRSMKTNAESLKKELLAQNESQDGVIFKMKNDPRITRFGRIMRKLSIDEMPQLYNVLKGDMSLVGPRPAVPSEVKEYTLKERKRLNIVPGITCIWQISGRSDIPFNKQVELDLMYIQSQNLFKDLKILLKTIPAVILGKGAY